MPYMYEMKPVVHVRSKPPAKTFDLGEYIKKKNNFTVAGVFDSRSRKGIVVLGSASHGSLHREGAKELGIPPCWEDPENTLEVSADFYPGNNTLSVFLDKMNEGHVEDIPSRH